MNKPHSEKVLMKQNLPVLFELKSSGCPPDKKETLDHLAEGQSNQNQLQSPFYVPVNVQQQQFNNINSFSDGIVFSEPNITIPPGAMQQSLNSENTIPFSNTNAFVRRSDGGFYDPKVGGSSWINKNTSLQMNNPFVDNNNLRLGNSEWNEDVNNSNIYKMLSDSLPQGSVSKNYKRNISRKEKKKVEQLVEEGVFLFTRQKLIDSHRLLNEALHIDFGNPLALNVKGMCLKRFKQYNDALSCFILAIEYNPNDWEGYNNLGIMFKGNGMFEEAMKAFSDAIRLFMNTKKKSEKKDLSGYFRDGISECYWNISKERCAAHDQLAVVLTDVGTKYKVSGDVKSSICFYSQAIKMNPKYSPAYFNLGVISSEKRQYEDSLKYYDQAIAHNPRYSEALCNIGVLHKNHGNIDIAIEHYNKALRYNPNFEIGNINLSIAYTEKGTRIKNSGNLAEGVRYYKKSLSYNSENSDAWYNLGVVLAEQNNIEEAKTAYEMAINFNPGCAQAYNNLGVIYKDRGNLPKAIHYYERALIANSEFSQTLNNLGVIYTLLGKLDEAYMYCKRAVSSNPNYSEAYNNLGVLYRDEGLIKEAVICYSNCLKLDPNSRSAGQNRLLALNSLIPYLLDSLENDLKENFRNNNDDNSKNKNSNDNNSNSSKSNNNSNNKNNVVEFKAENSFELVYDSEGSVEAHRRINDDKTLMVKIFEEHTKWGVKFTNLFTQYTEWNHVLKNPSKKPITIGYLSADFFIHSVSYFIEAPLKYASKDFKIIIYSNVMREDVKTKSFKNMGFLWRSVTNMKTEEVAKCIREDSVDILIELTGHTAGNRLDVMAMKPAPVQISWIGYPNTTGLSTIDYKITDSIADPLDSAQQYCEKLVRLNGCFLCYTPVPNSPKVSPLPCLTSGFITFGCFNNLAKFNLYHLRTWSIILKSVPKSRLLMKCKPFASESVKQKFLNMFQSFGIDSQRIDLIPLVSSTENHLSMYSMVDISIDTYPYSGTTTTCEALFCGVPVITLSYKSKYCPHSHNVSASLLSRIPGMEWAVARSEKEYIEIAVQLANNIPKLKELRGCLRDKMLKSDLCDGRKFTAEFEKTLKKLWADYCEYA